MTISKDSTAPLVVVVGVTGSQGGSVVKALAESDKPYRIRGLTRDPSKAEARALSERGVEVFAVDPTVKNKERVFKAFEGATYAFAMTVDRFTKGQETAEGKLFVDAAKAADVNLLVWSGLPSVTEISQGKYKNVYPFDEKAEITAYAKSTGIHFVTVQAGAFMQNYTGRLAPRKQDDGSYAIFSAASPGALLPLIDIKKDYGVFVRKAIEQPFESGTSIHAYSELQSFSDMVRIISDVTGKKVSYVQVPEEKFLAGIASMRLPSSFGSAMFEMWRYFSEFGYWGSADIKSSQGGLARKIDTWEDYVKETDWSNLLA